MPAIPTCDVLCVVHDSLGNPSSGATITATLSRPEIYQGFVVPRQTSAKTDADGSAVLALWPNQLGSNASYYNIRITSRDGRSVAMTATIPNATSVNLHEVVSLPTYPGKPDGLLIVEQAVSAAALAADAKVAAEAARDIAVSAGLSASASNDQAQAAVVDVFNHYYGASATDPTSRPDGTAMQIGDEYFNTATGVRKVYAGGGAGWQDTSAAALAASTGAGLIGWIRIAAGAVATKVGTWIGWQDASPFDFMSVAQIADVMAGTLSYDTIPAFNAALATGRPVKVPHGTGWKYRLDSTLSVPAGASLKSNGAYLRLSSGVNSHVVRIASGADNVEIEGFEVDGNKAGNTGGNGISTGGGGCTNVRILGNRVHDCSGSGVYIDGTTVTGIQVSGNFAWGNAAAGITGNNVDKFAFDGNFAWLNGTHGIGLIGIGTNGSISHNVAWDNGQGTPSADNITGYNSGNAKIAFVGNVCRGGLNNGMHVGGSALNVSGNVVTGASFHGIYVSPNAGNGDDVVISGNTVKGNGYSGIWLRNCTSGVVSGNLVRDAGQHGILIDGCTDVAITGNTVRASGLDGFHAGATVASSRLTIVGNVFVSNLGDGIDIGNVSRSVITGNKSSLNTGYGLNVNASESYNAISGNHVSANTAGQIATPATTSAVSGNITEESFSVASAATVTLPPSGEFFNITGTTGITSITASFIGRRVTLQFTGILTITDGGNLRLAGNFTTASTSTITLVSDGANWVECSRSTS